MVFETATLEEVVALIKANDLRTAEAKARALSGMRKDFLSALLLSYVRFMLGEYGKAAEAGLKAAGMARNSTDSEIAMLLVAAAHAAMGNRRDARYAAKTFAKPGSFWATYLEMILLLDEGRGEEAAKLIDVLVSRDRKLALNLLEQMVTKKEQKKNRNR